MLHPKCGAMSEPKISVIIPVININDNFYKSINSVISQSLKEIEILVIHNQPFFPIDKNFYFNDPRVKIIKNYHNKAAWYSRNLGIKEAKSKYISILDSEDILINNHLNKAYEVLEKKKHDLYCSGYINYFGKKIIELRQHSKNSISFYDIITLNPIGHSTVVFRKNNFSLYKNYELRHDLALWINLYKNNYKFYYNFGFACLRIISKDSLSVNKLKTLTYYYKIYRKEGNFSTLNSIFLILLLLIIHLGRITNFRIIKSDNYKINNLIKFLKT